MHLCQLSGVYLKSTCSLSLHFDLSGQQSRHFPSARRKLFDDAPRINFEIAALANRCCIFENTDLWLPIFTDSAAVAATLKTQFSITSLCPCCQTAAHLSIEALGAELRLASASRRRLRPSLKWLFNACGGVLKTQAQYCVSDGIYVPAQPAE